MIETGADFLFAIKETTSTEFDADAAQFLDALVKREAEGFTLAGAVGDRRDRLMFYSGMLRGVQLKLARVRIDAEREANELGVDVVTGNKVRKTVGH